MKTLLDTINLYAASIEVDAKALGGSQVVWKRSTRRPTARAIDHEQQGSSSQNDATLTPTFVTMVSLVAWLREFNYHSLELESP